MVVVRQLRLDSGKLDLPCLDAQGGLQVVEIKRGALYRDTIAQAVDYAACDVPGWAHPGRSASSESAIGLTTALGIRDDRNTPYRWHLSVLPVRLKAQSLGPYVRSAQRPAIASC